MDSSLNFTLNENNEPIIKVSGNELLGLTDLGISLNSGSLYFSSSKSLALDERIGPYIKHENDHIVFGISGEDAVHLTSDGKVGIGTADPSYNLHVYVPSNLTTEGGLRFTTPSYTGALWKYHNPSIYSTTNIGTGQGMTLFSGTENIYFMIGGTTRVRMTYFPAGGATGTNTYGLRYASTLIMFGSGNSPTAPLELEMNLGNGTQSELLYTQNLNSRYIDPGSWWYQYANVNFGSSSNHNSDTSLYALGGVAAYEWAAYSDERIKTNIQEMDSSACLDAIRLLQPCSFNFIDYRKNWSHKTIGFISQEVESIIPECVKYLRETIPNIYQLGTYYIDSSGNQYISLPNYDMNKIEYDNSGNIYSNLSLYDEKNTEIRANLIGVVSSECIQISTKENIPEQIFVYGQMIDNYQHLNYDGIFTVGTSALKEIDKHMTDHIHTLDKLEEQIRDFEILLSEIEAN